MPTNHSSSINQRFRKLLHNPKPYTPWLIQIILGVINITGSIITICVALGQLEGQFALLGAIIAIFLFGIINLFLLHQYEKSKVRSLRAYRTFWYLHEIVESIRTCRTDGNSVEDYKNVINDICFYKFQEFLRARFGVEFNITIKYRFADKLLCIRSPKQSPNRDKNEEIKDNHIFNILFKDTTKFGAIIVEDIENPEDEIKNIFGHPYLLEVQKRAKEQGYRSFMALPIRTSTVNIHLGAANSGCTAKPTIGMIGFDYPEPGIFGHIENDEKYLFFTFVDLLAEIVCGLQKYFEKQYIQMDNKKQISVAVE